MINLQQNLVNYKNSNAFKWIVKNWLTVAIILILSFTAISFSSWLRSKEQLKRNQEASLLYGKALYYFENAQYPQFYITAQQLLGEGKRRAGAKAYQNTSYAAMVAFLIASHAARTSDWLTAEKYLLQVLNNKHTSRMLRQLARFRLSRIYAEQGEWNKVDKILDQVEDDFFIDSNKEMHKKLEELKKQNNMIN